MYNYRCQRCGYEQNSIEGPQIIHICNNCNKVDILLKSINLYKASKSEIIRILKEELNRRKTKSISKIDYIWKTKDGQKIEISKLDENHIQNIIKLVLDKG